MKFLKSPFVVAVLSVVFATLAHPPQGCAQG